MLASLVPRSGLSHLQPCITDFLQHDEMDQSAKIGGKGVANACPDSCRRIAYKLNADSSGIDVRVQVTCLIELYAQSTGWTNGLNAMALYILANMLRQPAKNLLL